MVPRASAPEEEKEKRLRTLEDANKLPLN